MRKNYFVIAAILMAFFVASCQREQSADKSGQSSEAKDQQISAEVQTLSLAIKLTRYGYEHESAEALVEAADILLANPIARLEIAPVRGDAGGNPINDASDAGTSNSINPEKLLADARNFAGEDAFLLQMIEREEQKLALLVSQPFEGSERGGALNKGYITESANPHQSDIYKLDFTAKHLATVDVVGDGQSDLNLYIYDKEGNLITSDMGNTDVCHCEWVPEYSGSHIIKIINRGNNVNEYSLTFEK